MAAAHADSATTSVSGARVASWVGLGVGPVAAVVAWALLPDLSHAARGTAAVAVLMAVWWLTEAISLSATSLLPLVLFPVMGVLPFSQAASPYASDVIFLFMGGFILGLAMERWGLHRRIALVTVLLVGTSPKRLVAGFMLASAVISMWVSNTATAIMMLPIALSVITLVRDRSHPPGTPVELRHSPDPNFDATLMLGVAYAASIGGVATLIGSPPNAVFKGFVETSLHQQVGFTGWMKVGLPTVAIFLPIAWFYMTSISEPVRLKTIPGGREMIKAELRALGPVSRGEGVVMAVFLLTVLLWVSRPSVVSLAKANGITSLQAINDASIAMFGSLLLFIIPIKPREHVFAMDWGTVQRLPWGALILFGGGLSLAAAITSSGLDATMGHAFAGLKGLPGWVIVLVIAAVVCFASELASNTAVATAILPVLAAAAPSMGVEPVRLMVPATLAASLAFMLPVGTPPNAIVFATGHATMRQMARTGFALNVMAIAVITVVSEVVWRFVASG